MCNMRLLNFYQNITNQITPSFKRVQTTPFFKQKFDKNLIIKSINIEI